MKPTYTSARSAMDGYSARYWASTSFGSASIRT